MSEKLHTNPDSAPAKTGWEDMDVVNTFHKLNDYDDPNAAYAEHLARVAKKNAEAKNAEAKKEAKLEKPDSDYGQDIRDIMEEVAAEEAEEEADKKAAAEAETKPDSDYGQDIRDVIAEEQAEQAEDQAHEAEEKAQKEAEEKEKREAEEKEKRAAEEKEKKSSEEKEQEGQGKEKGEAEPQGDDAIMRELDGLSKELEGPLAVVSGDFTADKKDLAHDYAERQLNKEVEEAKGLKGFISRIWKGNLLKKFYEKKYEREIFSGQRKVEEDGKEVSLDEVMESRSESAMKRMVLGTTAEYAEMVHTKAGEKLTEADEETTKGVKEAIEWFAGAKIPEGGTLEDLKAEFNNRVGLLYAENRDKKLINNALMTAEKVREKLGPVAESADVAEQARMAAEHQEALNRIMEGFKVYNAEVRDNIRTEAHRDNIDKIVNKYESSKLGQFIPPEIIAAAAGTAYSLLQSGARAAAGAGFGIGVSGIFAGLRERNRVTEDRTRKQRDVAAGYEYSEDGKDRLSKKRAKYEAKLGGTFYNVESASALTSAIEAAKESDDPSKLLEAIASARVRVEYSDNANKDLISYSSPDKIGDERLALDLALIEAEHSLSDEDKEKLEAMKGVIEKNIKEDVEAQDKKFKHERLKLAAKASAKTIATGAAVFFGSQEVMAVIDPNKIGVFEKAGLLKTNNAENAEETVLASLMGGRGTYVIPGSEDEYRLEENGFKKVETQPAYTETRTELVEVDPSDAATQKFKYDGWANNGTKVSDGNELRVYLKDGQFSSGMLGNSTMNGQTFNYDELAAAGKIKGYLTIGGSKFELVGTQGPNGITWGENGIFTTTTGETIKAIGDNGEKLYKYFEVALDNGTDAEGFTHIIPFATTTGRDTFAGTISKVTETLVEHPATYDYVKDFIKVPIVSEVTRGLFTGGIVLPGVTSRVGLGEARVPGATAETPTEEAPEAPTEEAPTGETPETPAGGAPETPTEAPEAPAEGPTEVPAGAPGTGENTGEENTGESSAEPSPEPSPEQPTAETPANGEEEPSPQDLARRRVFEAFDDAMNVLTPAGIGLMTSDEPMDANLVNRIESWWENLTPEIRTKVRAFEQEDKNSQYGSALRVWLEGNPEA